MHVGTQFAQHEHHLECPRGVIGRQRHVPPAREHRDAHRGCGGDDLLAQFGNAGHAFDTRQVLVTERGNLVPVDLGCTDRARTATPSSHRGDEGGLEDGEDQATVTPVASPSTPPRPAT